MQGQGSGRVPTLQALIVGLTLMRGLALSLFAAEDYPKAKTKKKDEPLTVSKIAAILDDMLADEQTLLQAVEEIKSEVAIVKTRASVQHTFLATGAPCP